MKANEALITRYIKNNYTLGDFVVDRVGTNLDYVRYDFSSVSQSGNHCLINIRPAVGKNAILQVGSSSTSFGQLVGDPWGNLLFQTFRDLSGSGDIGFSPVSKQVDIDAFTKQRAMSWHVAGNLYYGYLYYYRVPDSSSAEFWVADSAGNGAVLAPHCDPSELLSIAGSSFDDPNVEYPYSFRHENALLGTGQIIDMSKMVAFVENKMQEQLGDEAGKIIYQYDLPPERRLTVEEWMAKAVDEQAEQILKKLDQMSWIKVSSTDIPPDAVEEVEEIINQELTEYVAVKALDLESLKLVDTRQQRQVVREVKTGQRIKRLKENYALRDDGLYRRPTLDDMDLKAELAQKISLPDWILLRVKSGKTAAQYQQEFRQDLSARLQLQFPDVELASLRH